MDLSGGSCVFSFLDMALRPVNVPSHGLGFTVSFFTFIAANYYPIVYTDSTATSSGDLKFTVTSPAPVLVAVFSATKASVASL